MHESDEGREASKTRRAEHQHQLTSSYQSIGFGKRGERELSGRHEDIREVKLRVKIFALAGVRREGEDRPQLPTQLVRPRNPPARSKLTKLTLCNSKFFTALLLRSRSDAEEPA